MEIIERIFNAETGEESEIVRPMTEQELAEYERAELIRQQIHQAAAEASARRTAALSKLENLGLTADDLKALGL